MAAYAANQETRKISNQSPLSTLGRKDTCRSKRAIFSHLHHGYYRDWLWSVALRVLCTGNFHYRFLHHRITESCLQQWITETASYGKVTFIYNMFRLITDDLSAQRLEPPNNEPRALSAYPILPELQAYYLYIFFFC